MRGDFSRRTFRAARHYSAVFLQQGRVTLDADFNEQVEIERHQRRMVVRDVIGRCGGPKGAAGFEVAVGDSGRQLLIGAGRYYVDGMLVENEQTCAFESQPDLPAAADLIRQASESGGRYLLYLDVWDQLITSLEDSTLSEPALGGPDTSVRLRTIWQVRLSNRGKAVRARTARCHTDDEAAGDEGDREPGAARPTLDVRTGAGGYVGPENQLYRVEIHDPGAEGAAPATFKWSRDNGSLAVAVRQVRGAQITFASKAEDAARRLLAGSWLELTDHALDLDGRPGQLVQIESTDLEESTLTVTSAPDPLADTADGVDPVRRPKARLWDGFGRLDEAGESGWLELEQGIEVAFGGGVSHAGDYWVFPARTAGRQVEWPAGPQPAERIEHRCCPLAVVELGVGRKGWRLVEDRRRIFAPLRGGG